MSNKKSMFTFTYIRKISDGRRFGGYLSGRTWDDAISQAERLGVIVDGVLVSTYPADGGLPTEYNGEQCPPCPQRLRNHPNVQ